MRLEGLDAPETHYQATGLGLLRQPGPSSGAAADALLHHLGFRSIRRDKNEKVLETLPEAVHGTLALSRTDRFGRAVGWVFRGLARHMDGSEQPLLPAMIPHSLNGVLLELGHAYPTFYTTLPRALRDGCSRLSKKAQVARRGVWAHDCTHEGFLLDITVMSDRQQLVWPKLFRRLADHQGRLQSPCTLESWKIALDHHVGTVYLESAECSLPFSQLLHAEGDVCRLLTPMENVVFSAQ